MLIAARIIKALVVLALFFGGGLLVLTGSGVNLEEMMQGRIGAGVVIAAGALMQGLVGAVRLTSYELAVGVLMLALGLLVALYRT
jgi:hypothetical protein